MEVLCLFVYYVVFFFFFFFFFFFLMTSQTRGVLGATCKAEKACESQGAGAPLRHSQDTPQDAGFWVRGSYSRIRAPS